MEEPVTDVPNVGWRTKLDFTFPQKRSQFRWYSFWQLYPHVMLFLRYIVEYIWKKLTGKSVIMDFLVTASCDQQSGVPLGGIGGGTIGRGFRGEFSRFQITPGHYEYPSITVNCDQFIINIQNASKETIYQKVLSYHRKPIRGKLSAWDWSFPGEDAEYTALYPRSWTVFNIQEHNIKVICRQISPVIPGNYKDSSIPGAVFEWNVFNFSEDTKYVSITFTFQSGAGCKKYDAENIKSEIFENSSSHNTISGICITQTLKGQPLTYGLASPKKDSFNVTSMVFDPNSDGQSLWKALEKDGELDGANNFFGKSDIACGLCSRTSIEPNNSSKFTFSLTWDNPVVQFSEGLKLYKRYYTKYFGDSGNAAPNMCLYCIDNYPDWERSIFEWQAPVVQNKNLPDWYKSALFNELYYVTDGGTVWLLVDEDLPDGDPRKDYGRFAYLEGHEYKMYNTYDVHFYASFALAMLWPKLQLSIQYDFKDAVSREDKRIFWFLYNGERGLRKYKDSVPHDLGDPDEAPFESINAYNIHNVSKWKDLNLKFVLQVYRDFIITSDINYLHDMFPQALVVMRAALNWAAADDGMIRNSGFPDQTYDEWTMSGISAYCGSLWLAALSVFIRMARTVNQSSIADDYSIILDKAKVAFEKNLWNDLRRSMETDQYLFMSFPHCTPLSKCVVKWYIPWSSTPFQPPDVHAAYLGALNAQGQYYKFDNSGGSHSDSIMADQLCGLWYLHCCNVSDEIFSSEKAKQALQFIYKMNVCGYYNGSQGAVNGMKPDGKVDTSAIQSEEVWTGVTYGLASLMIFEGFHKEGLETAKGLYETVYEKSGLGFATPEGLVQLNSFRAISYMRPLSIWSIQLALESSKIFDSII